MTEANRKVYDIYSKIKWYANKMDKAIELEDYSTARTLQNRAYGYILACYEQGLISRDVFYKLNAMIRR